ncbi:hypothetical protein Salat_2470700 [Sesamum alatum]|uniref:RNase H type-1 domain-containing protein n=1 Tax=Sesamum alatum TaxID=300844 RepID=A0AAE1XR14_9LAMI|nr:hypothetical protein Salat_2470700 [Sesamum alatum]
MLLRVRDRIFSQWCGGPLFGKRRLPIETGCPLCSEVFEDVHHVFLLCPFSRQVWALTGLSWQAIWRNRNLKLMENCEATAMAVVCGARAFQSSFAEAFQPTAALPPRPVVIRWECPPPGTLKFNFDGAVFRDCNEVSVGIILQNSEGSYVAWRTQRYAFLSAANHVEALAARLAVEWAVELTGGPFCFEGDCQTVIRDINARHFGWSPLGAVLQDIDRLLLQLPGSRFSFVKRSANRVAHGLARRSILLGEGFVPPDFICDLLQLDVSDVLIPNE